MQSVKRNVEGPFIKKSDDENQVSILLKDYQEADKLLARIVDSVTAWRDSCAHLVGCQSNLAGEYKGINSPITSSIRNDAPPVDEATLAKTTKLHDDYEDIKGDLLQELEAVDQYMINPVLQARNYISPLKKTMKKRGDRKMDFDLQQKRVDSIKKKKGKSERDRMNLAKAEEELENAREGYNAADENLRRSLPPLLTAIFSMLPIILTTQIEIQNAFLANLYTMMHNYCEHEGFPSPPPPMEQVIEDWKRDFHLVHKQVESFNCLKGGKAIKQPMGSGSSSTQQGGTKTPRITSTSNNNNNRSTTEPSTRRNSSSTLSDRPLSPSTTSTSLTVPTNPDTTSRRPSTESSLDSSSFIPLPEYFQSPTASPAAFTASPAGPNVDYFGRERQPSYSGLSGTTASSSSPALTPGSGSGSGAGPTSSLTAAAAAKKKPPPPTPKPKPAGINKIAFVTALYDYDGQEGDELVIREGDRIRLLKKNGDDWWEGELRGARGYFPANYVAE